MPMGLKSTESVISIMFCLGNFIINLCVTRAIIKNIILLNNNNIKLSGPASVAKILGRDKTPIPITVITNIENN